MFTLLSFSTDHFVTRSGSCNASLRRLVWRCVKARKENKFKAVYDHSERLYSRNVCKIYYYLLRCNVCNWFRSVSRAIWLVLLQQEQQHQQMCFVVFLSFFLCCAFYRHSWMEMPGRENHIKAFSWLGLFFFPFSFTFSSLSFFSSSRLLQFHGQRYSATRKYSLRVALISICKYFFTFLFLSFSLPCFEFQLTARIALNWSFCRTCVAIHSPAPPSFIYWYKEGRVINYSQRGGISVLTERKTRTSKLVISKAMSSDSGNYTCIPSSSGKLTCCCRCRFPVAHCLCVDYFVVTC